MCRTVSYELAKRIMGNNFIGPQELGEIQGLPLKVGKRIPKIIFSQEELEEKKDDYLLILGIKSFADGSFVTIRRMIAYLGKDPGVKEPCFYNQDWYENERFIDEIMYDGWYLIRKNVYDQSRAIDPNLLEDKYLFPSAVCCTYTFFVAWLACNMRLWYLDYVWCKDRDHNGDRIYVGKYYDADGMNKNGFSIHRHLSLKDCYGCVD